MAKLLTTKDAVKLVNRASEGNVDEVVSLEKISFDQYRKDTLYTATGIGMFSGAKTVSIVEDWPGQQLNSRLKGPDWRWINGPDCDAMLAHNIRSYLVNHRDVRDLLIRRRGNGNIRAILSSEYVPLNSTDVFGIVDTLLAKEPGARIASFFTGDLSRGYVILPDVVLRPDPRGGALHPACYISNEETGRGMIRINPGLFSSYCLNGAVMGWQRRDDELGSFQSVHRWLDVETLTTLVAKFFAKSMEAAESVAAAYEESFTVKLCAASQEAVSKCIDNLRRQFGFTIEKSAQWQLTTLTEAQNRGSEYVMLSDVVNGLTVLSHTTESAYEAEENEVAAGQLLEQLFRRSASVEMAEVEREQYQLNF